MDATSTVVGNVNRTREPVNAADPQHPPGQPSGKLSLSRDGVTSAPGTSPTSVLPLQSVELEVFGAGEQTSFHQAPEAASQSQIDIWQNELAEAEALDAELEQELRAIQTAGLSAEERYEKLMEAAKIAICLCGSGAVLSAIVAGWHAALPYRDTQVYGPLTEQDLQAHFRPVERSLEALGGFVLACASSLVAHVVARRRSRSATDAIDLARRHQLEHRSGMHRLTELADQGPMVFHTPEASMSRHSNSGHSLNEGEPGDP